MDLERDAQLARSPSAGGARDWSELPVDVLSSISVKLGAVEVLTGAGLVCRSWLEAAKLPELWRCVDMTDYDEVKIGKPDLCAMAKVAANRSCGQLETFSGRRFVTDELLIYIADRSTSIKRVGFISCWDVTNKGFTQFVTRCPLLEDLSLRCCPHINGREAYEATGKACAHLKRFALEGCLGMIAVGLGIAAMRELRSLSLSGVWIHNRELEEILDSCPRLETLSVLDCFSLVDSGALRAKCSRIRRVEFRNPKFQHEHYKP